MIAILGDTHMPRGRRKLPDACVDQLAAAELIVHVGDFTGIEALERIGSLGPPLLAVHGNVDEPEVVARLPERRLLVHRGVRIGIVHDAGPRERRLQALRRAFPDADAVLFGHSHLPLHERSGGFQIFNPGSPTERRRAAIHSFGVAEVEGGKLRLAHVELG